MSDIAIVLTYLLIMGTNESHIKMCLPRLLSSSGRRLLVHVALGQAKVAILVLPFALAFTILVLAILNILAFTILAIAILDHEPLAHSVPSL